MYILWQRFACRGVFYPLCRVCKGSWSYTCLKAEQNLHFERCLNTRAREQWDAVFSNIALLSYCHINNLQGIFSPVFASLIPLREEYHHADHLVIKSLRCVAAERTVQTAYSQPVFIRITGCSLCWLRTGSFNSTFRSDQDSFLLHLQYGDSFTELVDDLLALMSYLLWWSLLARHPRLHANVLWCTKQSPTVRRAEVFWLKISSP